MPLPLECEFEVRCPPSVKQEGYLSDTCAILHESKQIECDTLSGMLSRKGIARHGVVSQIWAAKPLPVRTLRANQVNRANRKFE